MGDDEVLNHIREFENWSRERAQIEGEDGNATSYEELERRYEFLRMVLKRHPNFWKRRLSRAVKPNGKALDGNGDLRDSVSTNNYQEAARRDLDSFSKRVDVFNPSLLEVDELKIVVEKALNQNLTPFEIGMLGNFIAKGHTKEEIIEASEKAARQLKRPRLSYVDLLLNGKSN